MQRIEVVRYRPGSCVLRYELAWRLESSRRSLKQVLYGKVYGGGEGRLVGPVVTALRNLADGRPPSLPFLVPRFQAYVPDLRLALLEAVPGSPLLPALIRAQAGVGVAPTVDGPTPEGAVTACARIAAALHRSAIPVGAPRSLAGDLDLGEFAGHLAVAVRTARDAPGAAQNGAADLESAFLREYLRLTGSSDPDVLLARVAAYRTVTLARLAVRRWCQLKPQVLRPVQALLDQPPRIRIHVP